ncbi:shikimate dehydrogenase [Pseudidiomarina sediminum]|uniref:Shikimate dehydrogenase (NADP(+)) n=1 Tax=Pseudidiomarina sediminum TaxID=431675 RepID=A0A432ZAQ6_9GAMM|nr:shikimate dehydrogenase [Pseudidiomarina sediminum]RUO74991.1 shikimate dehydrogenase [Pseudidiomarina sediminum]
MMQFTVFGNPIEHSLSPRIHQLFAEQCGKQLDYSRSLTSKQRFAGAVASFFRAGGQGANVTVPFKEQAAELVTHLTPRAARAASVNTLIPLGQGQLAGDTTDGMGLLRDVERLVGAQGLPQRVVIIGAGGAARSVIEPFQEAGCEVYLSNRSAAKVTPLVQRFSALKVLPFEALGHSPSEEFNANFCLINATSASLAGHALPIDDGWFSAGVLTYDMMYGAQLTAFLQQAKRAGAGELADGLGMLVEQAALAFSLWHNGHVPETLPVLHQLRAELSG